MPILSIEVIDTMVQKTIAAKTVNQDKLDVWRNKLQKSVQYAVDTDRRQEQVFFRALLAIIDDEDVTLPDDSPYQIYLQEVKEAVQKPREKLNYKQLFDTIIAMYEYTGAASLHEVLRQTGVTEEQVNVIIGQIEQFDSETVLLREQLDVIVQNTIEVKTSTPEKLENWRDNIQQALSIAEEDQHIYEIAFFEALLMVLDDREVGLANDNPYYEYLQVILDSIKNSGLKAEIPAPSQEQDLGQPHESSVSESVERDDDMSKLPLDMIETMVETTIAVKTIAQGNFDDWRNNIQKSVTLATQSQRVHDKAFFEALLMVLDDGNVILSDNHPYHIHLQKVKEGISQFEADTSEEQKAISSFVSIYKDGGEGALREKLRQSGADDEKSDAIVAQIVQNNVHITKTLHDHATKPMLPNILIESMVQTTIRVKTESPEKLEKWRAELQRNKEGAVVNQKQDAKDFFEALLAIVDDEEAMLSEYHPYYLHLQEVKEALLSVPAEQDETDINVDTLVSKSILETADTIVANGTQAEDSLSEDEWLGWIEQNTVAVLTVSLEHLDEWKQVLQDEMMSNGYSEVAPKSKFLATLYNLLHNRLSALDELNPYYPNWQNIIVQVSRFKSGRRMKPEFLEKCVRTTIEVCTVNNEGNEAWRERLAKFLTLAKSRKDQQEIALFQALLDICEEHLPAISLDNPYISELQRIQSEVANFQNEILQDVEDTQDVEDLLDRTIFNPRALKVESLAEPFRSEMKGLLDALDIALSKISRNYPNDVEIVREEIGRATDEATKHEPDLKRLKIRGDSLKVAAANLNSIAPIVNQIAALLLRLGE